jgi:hypothetical protein
MRTGILKTAIIKTANEVLGIQKDRKPRDKRYEIKYFKRKHKVKGKLCLKRIIEKRDRDHL